MNAPLAAAGVRYLNEYARQAASLPGAGVPWLRRARDNAMQRFAHAGFPTRRDEDWKYTPLDAIENAHFDLAPPADTPAGADLPAALIDAHALPGSHLLVFVDGRYAPALSRPGEPPAGVVLDSLGTALAHGSPGLREMIGSERHASVFADLNLAFLRDGALVYLPAGSRLAAPVQLLFINRRLNLASQPRIVVLAGEGSSASVIEQHVGLPGSGGLANVVSDLMLAPAARLEHHRLVRDGQAALHIATVNVSQAAGSEFTSGAWAFGARLLRLGMNVDLAGRAACCELLGLYLADGRQHVDHHTRIDHRLPGAVSRQFYKGIADDRAHAVFNGRIVVHPDAAGSDAGQQNRNLLLSAEAEIDSKPQLEIWADDVQCSHGATVGPLDEEQLFYLRARGLDTPTARAMLVRGFAGEVLERVGLPALRERLTRYAGEKLARPAGEGGSP